MAIFSGKIIEAYYSNSENDTVEVIYKQGDKAINHYLKVDFKDQDFNDLIKNWSITSQKLLLIMNSKEKVFTNNKDPKSLMAFGAMGAHINMALQALKATGSNQ